MPRLQQSALKLLKCPPIFLNKEQAKTVCKQLLSTSEYRCWQACAIAVMSNHVHVVVGVPDDPDPSVLLRDFKSYASRALNQNWPKPESKTWWTESGSRRKLPDENAVHAATEYVKKQRHPLIVWMNDHSGERSA
jgi:REP element-mobilizing transposase RayT